ncbi:uncharacterized protein KY384_003666 [Bacidia gigantensis]|uniref:uncharacterized protein n=1 Tax=Bacidia gigantensis TaxID=2732470 RepID=UPI001D058A6F|nr:uncharacterized protein KY384_003666 [Bacidia gigantensis]KAG8532030.1 hypothetical protein KY384_003666 [Bacidia gigantensis]
MAAPTSAMSMDSASAQVKRLIAAQLKQVCKGASLPVSGAKAALQSRIISQLQYYLSQNDYEAFHRLKSLVFNPTLDQSIPLSSARTMPHNPMATPQRHLPNSFGVTPISYGTAQPLGASAQRSQLNFKESPFTRHITVLSKVHKLEAREATRDTFRDPLNLTQDVVTMLNDDNNTRVMVYCAADVGPSPFTLLDVAFPQQVELKVNGDDVKANLRGLKNKPGTTRPADITGLLRKRAGYNNELLITYALTKNRFNLVVNLVKQIPVESLVLELKQGKLISKDRVLREMQSRAEDQDIVATSSVLSLKCPLSYMRIDVPCRSTVCKHNQCFDATSFLQLQEQAPTWSCPVCHENVKFSNLQVDQYVEDILKSTPRSVDQVTIEPSGHWSIKGEEKPLLSSSKRQTSYESDKDLVEIDEPPCGKTVKSEYSQQPNMLSTPPVSSREPSTSTGKQSFGGNKRPAPYAADVIDLCTDSEDGEPVRTPKRRQTAPLTNGAPSSNTSDEIQFTDGAASPYPPKHPSYSSNFYPPRNQYPPTGYPRPYDQPSSY